VNEYGQSVAELGRIDPAIALWVPFSLFAALIGWMYWTIAYVPGGQPIGALERFAKTVGVAVVRLFGWLGPKRTKLLPPPHGGPQA